MSKKIETFGQRLTRLRLAAGYLSPSDLARAIWGEKPDKRGFILANNRDTIWRYEHDRGLPSRKNLPKLALALNIKPEDLLPEKARRAISQPRRTKIVARGDMADLDIAATVPLAVALRIIEVVEFFATPPPK